MVDTSFSSASIIAIISVFTSISCYVSKSRFKRSTGHYLLDITSALVIPFVAILASVLLFFQGWRLDPVLQVAYALILVCWSFECLYSSNLDTIDAYNLMISNLSTYDFSPRTNRRTVFKNPEHDNTDLGENSQIRKPHPTSANIIGKVSNNYNIDAAQPAFPIIQSTDHLSISSIKKSLDNINELLASGLINIEEHASLRQKILSNAINQ